MWSALAQPGRLLEAALLRPGASGHSSISVQVSLHASCLSCWTANGSSEFGGRGMGYEAWLVWLGPLLSL